MSFRNCPHCGAELALVGISTTLSICPVCRWVSDLVREANKVTPKLASPSPIKDQPVPGSAAWWLRQVDKPGPETTRGDVPRGKGKE